MGEGGGERERGRVGKERLRGKEREGAEGGGRGAERERRGQRGWEREGAEREERREREGTGERRMRERC